MLLWDRPVEIESLRIQGDDNDASLVEFLYDGHWSIGWRVPIHDRYGWGLQMFPDPERLERRHRLPSPAVATGLRVSGDTDNSDQWFALSEVQVFGRAAD